MQTKHNPNEDARIEWQEQFPEEMKTIHIKATGVNVSPKLGRTIENIWIIFWREFRSYFSTPIAYIVITAFLFVNGLLTLIGGFGMRDFTGDFFERGRCDLEPMFHLLPWLFLFFVPAIAMRLWAEERQIGSFELLMTMPMRSIEIILGKFFGAWAFVVVILLATLPLPIVLAFFGSPDYGQIAASYFGAILLAGAFLSIGSLVSSLTKDQIVAFISGIFISGFFVILGLPGILEFLLKINPELSRVASRIALSKRFDSIARGVLDVGDMLYYFIFIVFFLYLTVIVLKHKRL